MTDRTVSEQVVEIFEILKSTPPSTPQQVAIDAARYRNLRQRIKNHEVSVELWGFQFKGADDIHDRDDLDEFCDQSIAAEKEQANGQ